MQIKIEISTDRIASALAHAHCSYWANEMHFDKVTLKGYVIEEDGNVRHQLNAANVAHGVAQLASQHPYIFGKLLADDMDGPMGDVLLQLCAGVVRTDRGHDGEVKYG